MIVTDDDIRNATELVERVGAYYDAPDEDGVPPGDVLFLADNPHLLMVLGYDEFKSLEFYNDEYNVIELPDGTKVLEHEHEIKQLYGLSNFDASFGIESLYRDSRSGAWYWYEGMNKAMLNVQGPPADARRDVSLTDWLELLRKVRTQPDNKSRKLWLPSTWTRSVQRHHRLALADSVGDLLTAIKNQERDLRSIHWRDLEELVAELLRSRGLDVSVTPRSNDGGRDIIARGELIPGEPTLLAVEVKQKPVVGLADVQRALRANEDIPALMLATAGRFSAGVIKEKARERNCMRLFLKDGVALSQWISSYRR